MAGIIKGAMAGLGEGLVKAGAMYGDYAAKSALQAEAAEITRLRDERLSELRKGEARYEADLRSEPGRLAQEEIERETSKPAYDAGADSVRPHSPAERAKIEETALRRRGLVQDAMSVRQTEMQRERDMHARLDKEADNRREDERLAETKRHNQRVEVLQAAAEGRLKKMADMETAIKQIALDNAKRVRDLQTEFTTATPDRKKAINEEIQLITGKDNDNYLPVPIKDELGAITGYHVFDKKRGTWVEGQGPKPGGPAAPGKDGDKPPLSSFFRGGPKKDNPQPSSSASGGPSAAPARPAASGGERQRDPVLEAKDPELKALAVSLESKNPNESTRAWIQYTKRLKELQAGP